MARRALALVHWVLLGAACSTTPAGPDLPPALAAASRGDLVALEALAGDPRALAARDGHERTALHWAAAQGQVAALRWLLARNLDVEARARLDQRPLHLAALGGQLDATRALLDAGARVDARNLYGLTPLHLAERPEVAALLLERGADLHARDDRRMTPLHYAVHKTLAKLLIDRGASVTAVDDGGATPEQMTGVARCQAGALRVYPRREALRLAGEQGALQIVVLSTRLEPLRGLRLEAQAPGVALDVEPGPLGVFAPTQSTLYTLRARRRADTAEGKLPLALRWHSDAGLAARCDLHVDTRPAPTPEERGLLAAGSVPIRQRPGRLALAALGLVPLALLGLWFALRRRR